MGKEWNLLKESKGSVRGMNNWELQGIEWIEKEMDVMTLVEAGYIRRKSAPHRYYWTNGVKWTKLNMCEEWIARHWCKLDIEGHGKKG